MDLFMMNCELLTTCSALGYLEEEEYFKEPDCIDTVKCLIKYLHNEDNTCTIRVQLGAAQILQNDLLPIMSQFSFENDLFQVVLRLMVNLTQPSLLCFGGKIPKDTIMHRHFLDVMSYNQSYKESFGDNAAIWKVLAQKIYDVLETDWEDRKPEDTLLIERILVLIRNLLHTPPTSDDAKKTSTDLSTHDKLLWQIHQSGIDSILMYMAGSSTEQEWCLHVIEIVCLLLKEQNAEQLVKVGSLRSAAERQKEGDELLQLRKIEGAKKQQFRANMSPWHSRFGGTYVMEGTRALADDKDLIVHRPLRQCNKISFDDGKTKLKKAKNRRPLVEDTITRRSSVSIRSMLKEFCRGMLEGGYNVMMRSIRDRISREKAQDSDETYYFWAMSFFLEFNRLSNFQIDLVSETVQLSTLHFVETQMIGYYELMLNDKNEAQAWGRKIHLALRCYHEFLMTVHTMALSGDSSLKESAKVLLNNIFYVVEYREIFLTLLRKFDERKQTRGFLKDLIRVTHLFLKIFENYCKESSVVVQKKFRNKSKRAKKKKVPAKDSSSPPLTEEERAARWTAVVGQVREKVQLPTPEESLRGSDVFDPTSNISEDAQERQAVVKIQKALLRPDVDETVKLLRTARMIWPEKNVFGSADIAPAEEEKVLQEICFADLADVETPAHPEEPLEEDGGGDESEDEEQTPQRTKEIEYSFKEYIRKFAESKVILPYVTLLRSFEQNGSEINHCIVKMLHRVGYDLRMYGLLFQASLFRIFQKAFAAVKFDKSLKELTSFAKWIMGKFSEVSHTNTNLFLEVLFVKASLTDVYEIVEGYGSFSNDEKRKSGVVWSNEEKIELEELYNQYKDVDIDLIDGILSRITDETRTRRQISQQLVRQGLVDNIATLKRAKGSTAVVWRDDDVSELKTLFEEFKSSDEPLNNIMRMMSRKKSKKKVIEKLLSLELVADRKELFKKRAKKPRNRPSVTEVLHIGGGASDAEERMDTSESEASTSSDEEDGDPADRFRTSMELCLDAGFEEEIAWIRRSLEATLDDWKQCEEVSRQAVPIVPFTEAQEDAIANRRFKKLLKYLRLQPPANEQEVFWRIPSRLSVDDLETSIRLLSTFKRKRSNRESDNNSDTPGTSVQIVNPRKKRALVLDDADSDD